MKKSKPKRTNWKALYEDSCREKDDLVIRAHHWYHTYLKSDEARQALENDVLKQSQELAKLRVIQHHCHTCGRTHGAGSVSTKYEMDITVYSEKIPGEKRNYGWAVRFDNTGPADYAHEPGFIGITQYDESGNVKDRVLLSPDQVEAFVKFSRTYRHLVRGETKEQQP